MPKNLILYRILRLLRPNTSTDPSQDLFPMGTALALVGTHPEPSLMRNICSVSFVFSKYLVLMSSLSPRCLARRHFGRDMVPGKGIERARGTVMRKVFLGKM